MASQWECLLKNLGDWEGSFTRLSPQGELIEDVPSVTSLAGLNNNQTIRQIIRRTPAGQPTNEMVLEYSTLARSVLFHETGAFSQGSIQWGPFSEFGAELGLISGTRRLRLVQLYNAQGNLDQLTLIREKLAGTEASERPPLTVDDLLGEWRGEAVTRYADLRNPTQMETVLKIQCEGNQLIQQLEFAGTAIASTATIEGNILKFEEKTPAIQLLLLPDGASSNCPVSVPKGRPFVLELGWLIEPNLRQRLTRVYDDKGAWISLTLTTETKVL